MECALFCFRLALVWQPSLLASFWLNCEAVKFSWFSERFPIARNRGFRLEAHDVMTAVSCCAEPNVPVFSLHGAADVPDVQRPARDNRGPLRKILLSALGLKFGAIAGDSVAEDGTSGDGVMSQLAGMAGGRSGSSMPLQSNCKLRASALKKCSTDLGDNTAMEEPL